MAFSLQPFGVSPKQLFSSRILIPAHGPKRCRYSVEVMNAFTISALTKLPLKKLSLFSQKSKPE